MAAPMATPPGGEAGTTIPASGVRTYSTVWCTQVLAMFTTAVTNFAIGTGVYYHFTSGSLVLLAVAYTLAFIPFVLACPLAGPAVDRWGPRKSLVISSAGSLVLVAAVGLVPSGTDSPEWFAWLVLLGNAAFKALQIAALETAVPILMPKRYIPHANGSRMLLTATSAVLSAYAADALLPVTGLRPLAWIAASCVLIALVYATRTTIPPATRPEGPVSGGHGSPWRPAGETLGYVRRHRGLPALLLFFAIVNFVIGFVEVANRKIVPAFASTAALGLVLVIGSAGLLATTIWITVRGGPRRPVRGLVCWSLVFAAAAVIGATRENLFVISVAAVLFLGSTPFIVGITGTLLHLKTEPRLMGRMMSLKNLVIGLAYPAGNVAAVLSGHFTESLADGNGPGSGLVAALVGTGAGASRGYAILVMATGLLTALFVLIAARSTSLRRVTDLPDVTPADLAVPTSPPGSLPVEAEPDSGHPAPAT